MKRPGARDGFGGGKTLDKKGKGLVSRGKLWMTNGWKNREGPDPKKRLARGREIRKTTTKKIKKTEKKATKS